MLLTAQPGAGKTVLMAWLTDWLAREGSNRHYYIIPRYFIRRDSQTPLSSGGANSFLFALGHQLATLHPALFRPENLEVVVKQRVGEIMESGQVVGIQVEDLRISPFFQTALKVEQDVKIVTGELEGISIGRIVAEKRFLELENLQYLALLDPARLLQQQDPNARIIILIDALDELRYNSRQNNILQWLAGCPELPPNICFVVTSRPDEMLDLFKRRQKQWLREETINLQSEQVQTDLRCYADKFVSQELIKVTLNEQEIAAEGFTTEIVTKADGNFQYMAAFFRAIEQAQTEGQQEQLKRLLKLAELPVGLQELYAFFLTLIWDSVKEEKVEIVNTYDEQPAWEWLYQPILGILSVAREPLKAAQIANLGRIKVEDRWLQTALGRLGQFLDQVSNCYRLYHTTFPEFLTSSQTETNYPEYYLKPLEWHSKIVAYYRDRKAKWDEVEWRKTDNYGLLYLPVHLYLAEEKEKLYTLLTGSPKWMEAKSNKFGNAAYVDDLDLAINGEDKNGNKHFADPIEEPNQLRSLAKLYTARQVAHQRVNIPNLKTLIWLGRKTEALSHARLSNHDPSRKFDALLIIHYALQELKQLDPPILDEAERVVNEIPSNLDKAEALIKLATALVHSGFYNKAKDFLQKVEKVVEEIQENSDKAETLIKLTEALAYAQDFTEAKKVATKAEKAIRAIVNTSYRAKAQILGKLAMALGKVGCKTEAEALFNEALEVISKDKDSWRQAHTLTKLAIALAQVKSSQADSVFQKAIQAANVIPETWRQVDRLTQLVIALAQTQRQNEAKEVLIKVYDVIRTIDENNCHVTDVLSQFAEALAHIERIDIAKKVVDKILQKGKQVEVLSQLAILSYAQKNDHEVQDILTKARTIADKIEDGWEKVFALNNLIEALGETKNFNKVEEVVIAANKVRYENNEGFRKSETLSKLALFLAEVGHDKITVNLIFKEAEKIAFGLKNNLVKTEVLSELAVALERSGRTEKANLIWTKLDKVIDEVDEQNKAEILKKLAAAFACAKNFSRAEKIVIAIENNKLRADAQKKLVAELAQSQKFFEAKKVLQAIEYKPARAQALCHLAVHLADVKDIEAEAVFKEAEEIALSLDEDGIIKLLIMIELVAALSLTGKFAKAREIANLIKEDSIKTIALSKLATAYALVKKFVEAKNIAHEAESLNSKIKDEFYSLWISSELAIAFVQIKLFTKAFSILRQKETPSNFLNFLMEWKAAFGQIELGILADILQDSIHIFGWRYPDWYEIDTILLCSKSAKS